MNITNTPDENNLAREFANLLNRHGYAFQYSSIRIADELFGTKNSRWIFQSAEFPVELTTRSKGTRIDFILKSNEYPVYLLIECKRANPALKNWCFARAPYVRRNRTNEYLFVEVVSRDETGTNSRGMKWNTLDSSEAYHIAMEVKGKESGDSYGKGYGAIEEAASQVCHGLNGMVEMFVKRSLLETGLSAVLVPVILTTAILWTSSVDLGTANIGKGELDPSKVEIKPAPWVYYQYHQSPGLKHSFSKPIADKEEISNILDREYIRTIPIITANSIDDFLKSFDEDTYSLHDIIL